MQIKKYKAIRVTDRTTESKSRGKRDGQKEMMMEAKSEKVKLLKVLVREIKTKMGKSCPLSIAFHISRQLANLNNISRAAFPLAVPRISFWTACGGIIPHLTRHSQVRLG